MARIRTIKPDFWGHSKTSRVSRDARLLFLGLLNEADDEGRLLASAKTINGNVFPNDDDVTVHDVDLWLKELAGVGFVQLYEVEGVRYCLVRGFGTHQKISHATESRLPAPPDDAGENFGNASGEVPEEIRPDLEVEGEEEREGEATSPGPVATWRDLVAPSAAPSFLSEGESAFNEIGATYGPDCVDVVLHQLVAEGVTFQFASKMTKAFKDRLGASPAVPSATPHDPIVAAARKRAELDAEHLAKVKAEEAEVQALSREEREARIAARRSGSGRYMEAS